MKRVFLIVLDSLGVGALPDAAAFGDHDCNTLLRISQSAAFSADTVRKMGLGNVEGLSFLGRQSAPLAAVAKMRERSAGKDTTTGHWEIAGVISEKPMPTYPNGFPAEIIDAFCRETGRGVLCNRPYSGTQVIADYGGEHLQSGKLIVYTSGDSVFQIAAHERVVPTVTLYEYCKIARRLLRGKNAVGRVIARPFAGEYPNFYRTENRRDFSLEPPRATLLDAISAHGKSVLAVGKISDIFAGRGITERIVSHSNEEGMAQALLLQKRDFEGLCFINLVDFDMLYGHRQDVDGYARAFAQFDQWLPSFMAGMHAEDVLMITADHGCDPGDESTDHTREYTPFIMYGKSVQPVMLGVRDSFADIGATVADYLNIPFCGAGKSMLSLTQEIQDD